MESTDDEATERDNCAAILEANRRKFCNAVYRIKSHSDSDDSGDVVEEPEPNSVWNGWSELSWSMMRVDIILENFKNG